MKFKKSKSTLIPLKYYIGPKKLESYCYKKNYNFIKKIKKLNSLPENSGIV